MTTLDKWMLMFHGQAFVSQVVQTGPRGADELFSTAVSTVRQPIESLFNYLIDKTDIQNASKVRASKGLIAHIFGAIAASLLFWLF